MKFIRIAFRNLTRQKKRTILLASAIAFGIFIVTLVNGFSAGTVRTLEENVAELVGGHVFVNLYEKDGDKTVTLIRDDTKLIAAAKSLGIKDSQIQKTVGVQNGTLLFNGKNAPLAVYGVDWNDSQKLPNIGLPRDVLEKLKTTPNGLVINYKTAKDLNLQVNDEVTLKCETITGQANVGDFIVLFLTNDSSEFASRYGFTSREYAANLINLPTPESYLMLTIKLHSLEEAPLFAEQLKAKLATDYTFLQKDTQPLNFDTWVFKMTDGPDFTGTRIDVTTINDLMSFFTQASTVLAVVSLVLLAVLLAIIMIGIGNTFRMILLERTREIGTMRALGMHRGEVTSTMLWEAVLLSLVGVVGGLILSGIVMFIFGFISFGTDSIVSIFLQNGHLSFTFELRSILLSTFLVVLFTWLAALGPSRKAARLEPAEALRTSY